MTKNEARHILAVIRQAERVRGHLVSVWSTDLSGYRRKHHVAGWVAYRLGITREEAEKKIEEARNLS